MDSFQGSYKDGVTEGRYDCRYFSAASSIVRVIMFITYALTLSGYFYTFSVFLFLILALIFISVKPYRRNWYVYGRTDVIFILLLAMWSAGITCIMISRGKSSFTFAIFLTGIILALPLLYIPIVLFMYAWAICRRVVLYYFQLKIGIFGTMNPKNQDSSLIIC